MTRNPSASDAIGRELLLESRAESEQRLRKALAMLPSDAYQSAVQAMAEIAQVDRILAAAAARAKPAADDAEPPADETTASAGESRGPADPADRNESCQNEASFWPEVARKVGRRSVNAATIMAIAAEFGAELTPAKAARKLQTWKRVNIVERRERGLYAFTEKGRRQYEIGEYQYEDTMNTT